PRRRLVAVCGESDPRTPLADLAFELGRGIAQRDSVLVCGGLTGVMEHAARGARAAGGLTIGLLPGEDVHDANAYIDIAIATGLGHARNAILARTADGVVALGGGLGTLSEIALALRQRRNGCVALRSDRYQTNVDLEAVPARRLGNWADYLIGVARAIDQRYDKGPGFDAFVASDIPVGSGLSSSGALDVASAVALLAARGIEMPALESA